MRLGIELGIAANDHLPILSHAEVYNIGFILSVISFEMGRVEARRAFVTRIICLYFLLVLWGYFHIQISLFHMKFCLVVYRERNLDIFPQNVWLFSQKTTHTLL